MSILMLIIRETRSCFDFDTIERVAKASAGKFHLGFWLLHEMSTIFKDDTAPTPGGDYVWGVCWQIDPEYAVEVKTYLDYREKAGYTESNVDVFNVDESGREQVIVSQVRVPFFLDLCLLRRLTGNYLRGTRR